MQESFFALADSLTGLLTGPEVLLAGFSGERSDFVRFNKSLVRQAGNVHQRYLTLDLVSGQRHAVGTCTLTGQHDADRARAETLLNDLRACLPSVPEDPYLLYNTQPANTTQAAPSRLCDPAEMTEAVLSAGRGLDLVGILAAGGVFAGFANSLGQRNWFATHTFHLDWSFYHAADKAVKTSYAGFEWDSAAFAAKVDRAREQLDVLARPAKTIEPGRYRVFFSPAAVSEFMNMLAWGGFGLKAHRTKTTPLLKMLEGGQTLNPAVTLRENTAEGIAPNFHGGGFVRPPSVTMIEQGRIKDALVSPRSAKEYGAQTNGSESPSSLDMAAGDLPTNAVLERLGTGVYVNQVWYLNYSDRPACRLTGMTRFATLWVEDGQIVAPLNVMRFDETIYRMLGENLVALTAERDFLPDSMTYGGRSTSSQRLPGALVNDFTFTL